LRAFTVGLLSLSVFAAQAAASGSLVPRDGSAVLHPLRHGVVVVVKDGLARTTLRQVFRHDGEKAIEAVYQLPLGPEKTLTGVAVETGKLRLEGLLVPRLTALEIVAGVLEEVGEPGPSAAPAGSRPGLRLPVSPVLPGEYTVVEVSWLERLPMEEGTIAYVYPLDAETEGEAFDFNVTLRSIIPFAEVVCLNEGVTLTRESEHEARVVATGLHPVEGEELSVVATVMRRKPTLAVSTCKVEGKPGWFQALYTPSVVARRVTVPRDVILVLDTSGSMKGTKIEQLKAAVNYLISHLEPEDRVNVVRFHGDVIPFSPAPVPATPENVAKLTAFVARFVAQGGTNLTSAMAKGIDVRVAHGRVRTVAVLTDGMPNCGPAGFARLIDISRMGAGRGLEVHTFGIAPGANPYLLEGMALAGGGSLRMIRPDEEIRSVLQEFLDRTATPLLTGLNLTAREPWLYLKEVLPHPIPPAYQGEQVLISGRYVGTGKGTLLLEGRVGFERRQTEGISDFRLTPGGSQFVRWQFGLMEIARLDAAFRLRLTLPPDAYRAAMRESEPPERDEIARQIAALSFEHGLGSQMTSHLLVLPGDRARTDPRSRLEIDEALERAQTARIEAGAKPADTGALVQTIGRIDTVLAAPPRYRPPNTRGTRPPPTVPAPAPAQPPAAPAFSLSAFFAQRTGRESFKAEGGTEETQAAVRKALRWLTAHQHASGRMGAADFPALCLSNACSGTGKRAHDVGVTGLTMLAILGAGLTPKDADHGEALLKGLRYLMTEQDGDGCIGSRKDRRFVYDHAIATQALAEAYGMTGSVYLRQAAQDGLDFIAKCRNPGLAWRYGIRSKENDTSVTAWMTLALVSGREAGLTVDDGAFDGVRTWLGRATDPKTGRIGYTSPDTGPVRSPAVLDLFPPDKSEATTAAGLVCSLFLKASPNREVIRRGLSRLLAAPPVWDRRAGTVDLYYWHFGTLAAFQAGGTTWKTWNEAMVPVITAHQRTDGDEAGSFDPVGPWGIDGGRVYATALMALCLETYYRYPRLTPK